MIPPAPTLSSSSSFDCQTCGACCAHDEAWVVFIGEGDSDGLPDRFVDAERGGMCFEDGRCKGLAGTLGEAVRCTVYSRRPLVCRELQAGDPDCLVARAELERRTGRRLA